MGLSKLGKYIELVDRRNTENRLGVEDVKGIATSKIFIDSKANLQNVNLSSYKIVQKNEFAYVPDTSRRGEKIALAFQDERPCLISSIYTVFRVKDTTKLLPRYLMMFFNRPEFDRYARFHSWGSARETFGWDEMCDVVIDVPPIDVQRKYVAIYEGLLKNFNTYKRELNDLQTSCEAALSKASHSSTARPLSLFCKEINRRNASLSVTEERGISIGKTFMPTVAHAASLSNQKIVETNQFAFVPVTSRNGNKISISINKEAPVIVSATYVVFECDQSVALPDYLMMWFRRDDFDRFARFNSWGSARETLSFQDFSRYQIPVPSLDMQKSVVEIAKALKDKESFLQNLKERLSVLCPILIKGSQRNYK